MSAPRAAWPWQRSVFWRIAPWLIGVQVFIAVAAVAVSGAFATRQASGLVTGSLRVRLLALAEEIERRAQDDLYDGLTTLSGNLLFDLSARFPDPLILLDVDGQPLDTIAPDAEVFDNLVDVADVPLPADLDVYLLADTVVVAADVRRPEASWGLVPIYDPDGFLAGGVLVQPLAGTMAFELAGARQAYLQATGVVAVIAGVLAVLLGIGLTWQIVRPLRRITDRVTQIGAGDYRSRLPAARSDELGRLATSINRMAASVDESIDRLRTADRLRRDLVANIGHDLRTPLAALRGYLEEAERYQAEERPEQLEHALSVAASQGAYLQRLIDDLFELSILDSGHAPLRREPVPMGELLGEVVRAHTRAFATAKLTFSTDLAPDLPIVDADGVRLLRLFDNLLGNARAHTPPGGAVTLRAFPTGRHLVMEVTDTGGGMTPEQAAQVFTRYYRGESARTRKQGGTGLGLAISSAIAEAHGGTLSVESVLGKGTAFRLTLPLTSAPAAPAPTA
ncbi:MAG: HAMP domain-containing sensor histidine kinase [Bacteroidota bacterium]